MSDIEHPTSVTDALQQAEDEGLNDVLIIGTRKSGALFMRGYGLNKAEALHQMEIAKLFQLGLLTNAEDHDEEGEQE